jgi:predicted nucleic acid-binding Zn finger protein
MALLFSFCIQAEGAANNNYLVQYAICSSSSFVFSVILLLQLLQGDLYI